MRSRFNSPFGSRFSVLRLVVATSLMLLTSLMSGQTVKQLAIFIGTNGAGPEGVTWTQGRDGKLYGTTSAGGANGLGAFLRFDPATQNITVYHSFDGVDGSVPYGGVMLGSDNNFYGTTTQGGSAGAGLLYKITVNGIYTVLHSFMGGSDGFSPNGPPIEAADGNLYGTTSGFPSNTIEQATIYKFTPDGVYSVVSILAPLARAYDVSGLIQGSDDRLYTAAGRGSLRGENECGAIVKIGIYGGLPDYDSFDGTQGCAPTGPLTQASDGNYYGTTEFGGGIYQLTPAFGVTTLYSFGADGIQPNGGLVQGTDGNLYGTTYASRTGAAALYQWSLSSGYRLLYVFNPAATFTSHVTGGLMQHSSGLFYGATTTGGPVNDGFLFSLDMGLGPFVALVRPQGKVGSNAQILGQGLIGTTAVTFNGTPTTTFNVASDTYMTAEVPSGATTGPIVVTTATGSLTSNRNFTVTP
jgi:uncharacterized repeat protein (TIGR03803 family)